MDKKKAFDLVEWCYLRRVLKATGFGLTFLRWIKLLYTNVVGQLNENGFLTDPFLVGRGVCQGCPLSLLLYIFSAEPLACAIRNSSSIVGFPLTGSGRKTAKLSQYTDDTTVTLVTDSSVTYLLNLFQKYKSTSGAKLNLGKFSALRLGPWKLRNDPPALMKWSSEKITISGTILRSDCNTEEAWSKPVGRLRSSLESWKDRSLTFTGKSTVINVLLLSQLVHIGTILAIPPAVFREIMSMIWQLFWSVKTSSVSRETICRFKDLAGFGVIDLSKKLVSLPFL